jgi:putative transposase
MRFRFIEENRAALSTDRLCQIMNVSSRGYRAYRSRPISQRQREDMVILAHIREQHRLSLNSYGRPRMTEELKEIGLEVGHRRVGRLMRQNGISVVRTHKHKLLGHPKDALPANGSRRTVITSSTLHRTC